MKIIFLGTPEFSLASLDALVNSKHKILAVVTQMDRPSGRGQKLCQSAVKQYALEHNLKVLQYQKISRDGLEDLKTLKPDLMVTAAYGQILSQSIIDIPKYGIINVHASLLPKLRGASPIQSAIIKGESKTGITIMQTEAGLDTGDILNSVETEILEDETAGELSARLAEMSGKILLETIDQIEDGTVQKVKQQHTDATITTKILKDDCLINFNKSAKQIKCLVLGSNPEPIAFSYINGNIVKIYRAKVSDKDLSTNINVTAGTILPSSSAKSGVFVKCGSGVIEILEAQFPGGKVLTGKELINGRKLNALDKFLGYSEAFQMFNNSNKDKK